MLTPVLIAVLATQTASAALPPLRGAPTATTVAAARAPRAPVIDGRDDDDVWRLAAAITAFREFEPREDADPRYPTEARIAYDPHNFYVFIRAFDPAPDSILRLLARRDVRAATDQLKIIIDSYHDRRTGYEFAVNPAGVKRDYAIYDDGHEDGAWDAVWDVATQVDSLGWTAEFRIPLSQLRYSPGPSNTFGFAVWRDIERHTERVSWPLYRVSQAGLASQLGEVRGLEGLASPARLELAPYVVTKNVSVPTSDGFGRQQRLSVGADLKYGLTSNLTVDATVNPDFGQVEADPSVLNLSAFETRFEERRPFFLEGTGIFRVPVNCSQVNCSGEGLFYSRRIGRGPQLRDPRDVEAPTATTIIGAAKLTGRLPGGFTLGLLEAVTPREEGTDRSTIEPTTNYAALRGQQDFRRGQSGVGVMLTAVNRNLDQWTETTLRRNAYVGALDYRHRFGGGRYQVSGSLSLSRVAGTWQAIDQTKRSSTHYYQRPDDDLTLDTTTSLMGDAEEIYFGKVGGGLTRFETSYLRRSPGFEVNDLGFLRRANEQSWSNWLGLQFQKPRWFYQRAFWNFNWWQFWTVADGLPTERAANTNAHVQLNNRWWVHAGGTLGRVGGAFCDDCARGGPALRVDPFVSAWAGLEGDSRKVVVPFLWFNYWRGDGGRSEYRSVEPSAELRIASRFTTSLGVRLDRNVDDWKWKANITDALGITHYTFGHLVQHTGSLNWRLDYTVSPTLTLQVYASPFVSKGTYTNPRELADPRAVNYEDRFQPYGDPASAPEGFNFKQFRSNLVMRWEYRPGSTLFVVWTQGREQFEDAEGGRSLRGDFGRLFDAHPDNTFLVKVSYWLNR